MRTRVPGSKKLPGAIFNVRLLHSPVGFYRDVDGRATQGAVAEVSLMDEMNIPAIVSRTMNYDYEGNQLSQTQLIFDSLATFIRTFIE